MDKLTHLSAVLLLACSFSSTAEVISIADPQYSVPNNASGVIRPIRGMSMNKVTQQFGQPTQKHSAVGEPPITRWDYPKFAVFFEYSTVIHSVVPK